MKELKRIVERRGKKYEFIFHLLGYGNAYMEVILNDTIPYYTTCIFSIKEQIDNPEEYLENFFEGFIVGCSEIKASIEQESWITFEKFKGLNKYGMD